MTTPEEAKDPFGSEIKEEKNDVGHTSNKNDKAIDDIDQNNGKEEVSDNTLVENKSSSKDSDHYFEEQDFVARQFGKFIFMSKNMSHDFNYLMIFSIESLFLCFSRSNHWKGR